MKLHDDFMSVRIHRSLMQSLLLCCKTSLLASSTIEIIFQLNCLKTFNYFSQPAEPTGLAAPMWIWWVEYSLFLFSSCYHCSTMFVYWYFPVIWIHAGLLDNRRIRHRYALNNHSKALNTLKNDIAESFYHKIFLSRFYQKIPPLWDVSPLTYNFYYIFVGISHIDFNLLEKNRHTTD